MENVTIFELIHTMEKVNNKMLLDWKHRFKEDIGISHILVLHYVNENGMSRPSDIASHLGFAPASVTYLLGKLIDKEYCTRETDQSDGRVSYLKITERGIDVLQIAKRKGYEMRQSFLDTLTEDDRQQLFRIYEKLL